MCLLQYGQVSHGALEVCTHNYPHCISLQLAGWAWYFIHVCTKPHLVLLPLTGLLARFVQLPSHEIFWDREEASRVCFFPSCLCLNLTVIKCGALWGYTQSRMFALVDQCMHSSKDSYEEYHLAVETSGLARNETRVNQRCQFSRCMQPRPGFMENPNLLAIYRCY